MSSSLDMKVVFRPCFAGELPYIQSYSQQSTMRYTRGVTLGWSGQSVALHSLAYASRLSTAPAAPPRSLHSRNRRKRSLIHKHARIGLDDAIKT